MAKIRNAFGEHRTLSAAAGGRLVLKDAVIEVKPEEVYGYTQQAGWEPVDDEAQTAHDEAHEAYTAHDEAHEAYVEAIAAEYPPAPDEVSLDDGDGNQGNDPEQPNGNASRDEWAEYVVSRGLATADELDGLGRDQIRDTYKTEV